jgi:ATP-dependent exoDNAse (exonuclease V) alpha subunit
VAIFYLNIQSIGRRSGRRATAAAAYRAGERIRDERCGRVSDYSHRQDVLYKEIVLPSRFAGIELGWARDRSRLWNAAERAEVQRSARVAREYQVNLPFELAPAQRLKLAQSFARDLAERYQVAVDLAVHAPRPGSDPRNFHAHLLTTTREVTPFGLGPKSTIERSDAVRQAQGLGSARAEYTSVRERWADLINGALRAAQLDARVDARSLRAQGIDRAPRHLPWSVYKQAQRELHANVGADMRQKYQERGQARAEPARPSAEEVRRQGREQWLRLRAAAAETKPAPPRAADDDLGL